MNSKLKNISNDKLIEDYYKLVDYYNDFIANDSASEYANNVLQRLPEYENELRARGLISDTQAESESPKRVAKLQPVPSSRATTKETVQQFKPLKVVSNKGVSLKTSNYFTPRSRFATFQKKIRAMCRHLKQFKELKPLSQKVKKDKYRDTLIALKLECIKIVNASVPNEFKSKVLNEKYSVWGDSDNKFNLSNFDSFLDKYL